MSLAARPEDFAGASDEVVADGRALRRSLRRAERRRLLGNLGLTVPLLAFLLIFFVLPIVSVLTRSVENSQVSSVLPETAAALNRWNGEGLPDDLRDIAPQLRELLLDGARAVACRFCLRVAAGLRRICLCRLCLRHVTPER